MAKKTTKSFSDMVGELEWYGGTVELLDDERTIVTTLHVPNYTEKRRKRIGDDGTVVEDVIETDGNVINRTTVAANELWYGLVHARFFMIRAVSRLVPPDDQPIWKRRLEEAEAFMLTEQQRHDIAHIERLIEADNDEDNVVLQHRLQATKERLYLMRGRHAEAHEALGV